MNNPKYTSVIQWRLAEGIDSLSCPDDPVREEQLLKQYGDLRFELYEAHMQSLPRSEREQIQAGTHASQSHSRAGITKPYLLQFKKEYAHLKYVQSIELGFYHGDRLVISVTLSKRIPLDQLDREIPEYFRGFEVLVTGAD